MELLRFVFEPIDDNDASADVFAFVRYPDDIDKRNELTGQIEDAIYSYCESVGAWKYEELVNDVLKSFNVEFEIVNPITFCI